MEEKEETSPWRHEPSNKQTTRKDRATQQTIGGRLRWAKKPVYKYILSLFVICNHWVAFFSFCSAWSLSISSPILFKATSNLSFIPFMSWYLPVVADNWFHSSSINLLFAIVRDFVEEPYQCNSLLPKERGLQKWNFDLHNPVSNGLVVVFQKINVTCFVCFKSTLPCCLF